MYQAMMHKMFWQVGVVDFHRKAGGEDIIRLRRKEPKVLTAGVDLDPLDPTKDQTEYLTFSAFLLVRIPVDRIQFEW